METRSEISPAQSKQDEDLEIHRIDQGQEPEFYLALCKSSVTDQVSWQDLGSFSASVFSTEACV